MEEEQIRIIEKKQAWALQVNCAIYDKATTYTNIIMVGGYAGFFATWSNTSKLISPCMARTSAALMLLSLVIFIVWEVAKMAFLAINNRSLSSVVLAPLEEFEEMLARSQQSEQKLMARFGLVWPYVLFFSLSTALVSAGIHIWALIGAGFGL